MVETMTLDDAKEFARHARMDQPLYPITPSALAACICR